MIRTRIEIAEELHALYEMKTHVPTTSVFGDDNDEAIGAQIEVIQERLTFEQIQDRYDEDGPYVLSAAIDAERWLREDDEPVSESWQELISEHVPELLAAMA